MHGGALCSPWPHRSLTRRGLVGLHNLRLRARWVHVVREPERRVSVRCGSAGHVTVDLFDLSKHPIDAALLINIPPRPPAADCVVQPPHFMKDWPVANINYRWKEADMQSVNLHTAGWPTPVHDIAFAMSWISENLGPPNNGIRDMYIYGSYLGGGLAASSALTEAHAHLSTGIRGFVTYNGIYNWTMFLPDHRVNRATKATTGTKLPHLKLGSQDSRIKKLQAEIPQLFNTPSDLFDPFASPSLFFHNPGLDIPQYFSQSMLETSLVDAMSSGYFSPGNPPKRPRKSHLVFPPRESTLKIPYSLLLYDLEPTLYNKQSRQSKRQPNKARNSFFSQAEEFTGLLRRSVELVELKRRSKWDDDMLKWEGEPLKRVRLTGLEASQSAAYGRVELGIEGQTEAEEWLRSRIS